MSCRHCSLNRDIGGGESGGVLTRHAFASAVAGAASGASVLSAKDLGKVTFFWFSVFQLTHEKYKPFIFAAETLADLSMWVSRLITSMMKYLPISKSGPHNQEDCYSETEAEDPEDDSPRPNFDEQPKWRELEQDQLLTGSSETPSGSPLNSPLSRQKAYGSPASSPTDPAGEELESLIKCLKQGGVSLIGKQQMFTREQYRKSFVKRNKNPEINEKVHLIRTLQSTLKVGGV
ncbi:UNVERIFIED_CONTAM: hypothetical protein K2H54_051366 [Gekko kuhli]